jgi:hypothetical protein
MTSAQPKARALKVYGWVGYHRDAPGGNHQTREITAAPSKAAVARLLGTSVSALQNLSETGSTEEVAAAHAAPGVVLWQGLHVPPGTPFVARPAAGS